MISNYTFLESDQKAEIPHLGCYANEGKDIFLQEGIVYDLRHSEIISDTIHKLTHLADYLTEDFKIPPITHQFYSTSKSSPTQIDLVSHNKSKISTERLNQAYFSWRHFFWTDTPNIIQDDIKEIKGLEIHSLNEFATHPLYPELRKILREAEIDKALYSKSSDLVRYMALQAWGGWFHDLDCEIYIADAILELSKSFTFVGGLEKHKSSIKVEVCANVTGTPNVGSSCVGSTPNHPIINKTIDLMLRNLAPTNRSNLPKYVQFPCNLLQKVMYEVGPTALTMAYYLSANDLDILMPRNILFNAEYAWSTTPGTRCSTNHTISPDSLYEGIKIKTICADMFCGSWAFNNKNDYFKLIYYKENIDLYLYKAAYDGQLEEVIALIKDGANIESRNIYNITSITIASHRGHKEVVQTLLDANADITVTFNGLTPLNLAKANNHSDIVELLLKHKITPKTFVMKESDLMSIELLREKITEVSLCLSEQDPDLVLDLVSLCGDQLWI